MATVPHLIWQQRCQMEEGGGGVTVEVKSEGEGWRGDIMAIMDMTMPKSSMLPGWEMLLLPQVNYEYLLVGGTCPYISDDIKLPTDGVSQRLFFDRLGVAKMV